jgi:hypothetical protein
MTGPRPAGLPWTQAEIAQFHELFASGAKVGLIARKLKRSPGTIYARISSFKKAPRDLKFSAQRLPLSLPSERLAIAHANAQSNRIGGQSRQVEFGLKPNGAKA